MANKGNKRVLTQAGQARAITRAVKAYIAQFGCGDPNCATCKVGVALGVGALNKAFNLGGAMQRCPNRYE